MLSRISKIFAGRRVQVACTGAVGPSLQGGGVLAGSRGSTLPLQPPGTSRDLTARAPLSPSPGRPRGPGSRCPLTPIPSRGSPLPMVTSAKQQGPRLLPGDQRDLAHKQPLAVQAPGSPLTSPKPPFSSPRNTGAAQAWFQLGQGIPGAGEAEQFFFSLLDFGARINQSRRRRPLPVVSVSPGPPSAQPL